MHPSTQAKRVPVCCCYDLSPVSAEQRLPPDDECHWQTVQTLLQISLPPVCNNSASISSRRYLLLTLPILPMLQTTFGLCLCHSLAIHYRRLVAYGQAMVPSWTHTLCTVSFCRTTAQGPEHASLVINAIIIRLWHLTFESSCRVAKAGSRGEGQAICRGGKATGLDTGSDRARRRSPDQRKVCLARYVHIWHR